MREPIAGTDLCGLDEIDDGAARVFTFGTQWNAPEIVVVREGSQVRAYVNRCAHLSLPLNIDRRLRTADYRMFCDHHHAEFRFRDGLCVNGVCEGLSLTAVPLDIRDGRIVISESYSGRSAI